MRRATKRGSAQRWGVLVGLAATASQDLGPLAWGEGEGPGRLIDPEDLKWIYVSHTDLDHIGNLDAGRLSRAQVLLHPERNGYIYVMDRATGEVLSATPFVQMHAPVFRDATCAQRHSRAVRSRRRSASPATAS